VSEDEESVRGSGIDWAQRMSEPNCRSVLAKGGD
jgi:hypothetical protein